jgi:hypothetical protein
MTMANYRVIERGNGFAGVVAGAEVYDGDELLVVRQVSGAINTDDVRGNYIIAQCARADRDVTDLTDAEFGGLPDVKLVRDEAVESSACRLQPHCNLQLGHGGPCFPSMLRDGSF